MAVMKKSRYSKKSAKFQKIAKERISILFKEAGSAFSKDKKLAHRYVTLARKIAMKYKVRIPRELKRKYCKHCYRFLMPGKNCRVRNKDGGTVYYCLECKRYMRFPYR